MYGTLRRSFDIPLDDGGVVQANSLEFETLPLGRLLLETVPDALEENEDRVTKR